MQSCGVESPPNMKRADYYRGKIIAAVTSGSTLTLHGTGKRAGATAFTACRNAARDFGLVITDTKGSTALFEHTGTSPVSRGKADRVKWEIKVTSVATMAEGASPTDPDAVIAIPLWVENHDGDDVMVAAPDGELVVPLDGGGRRYIFAPRMFSVVEPALEPPAGIDAVRVPHVDGADGGADHEPLG